MNGNISEEHLKWETVATESVTNRADENHNKVEKMATLLIAQDLKEEAPSLGTTVPTS